MQCSRNRAHVPVVALTSASVGSNVERAERGGPACKIVTGVTQWGTPSVTSHAAGRTARGAEGCRKIWGELRVQVPLRLLVKTSGEKQFGIS